MATISAKELRLNLSKYLKRAMEGEEIEVIYRSKPAVKMQSATRHQAGNSNAVAAAMREYSRIVKSVPTPLIGHEPVKELYHDMLDQDTKYQDR
jgi:prevent-host-death family protein